jgi:hypothetical protein
MYLLDTSANAFNQKHKTILIKLTRFQILANNLQYKSAHRVTSDQKRRLSSLQKRVTEIWHVVETSVDHHEKSRRTSLPSSRTVFG